MFWVSGILAIFLGSLSFTYADLGPAVEQDGNNIKKGYQSCVLTLAALQEEFAPKILDLKPRKISAIVKGKDELRVHGEFYPDILVDNQPVIYFPSTSFLLNSVLIPGAASGPTKGHFTQKTYANLHGFYIPLKLSEVRDKLGDDEVTLVLRSYFLTAAFSTRSKYLKDEQLLIPIEKYSIVKNILYKTKPTNWSYEANKQITIEITPGLVVTPKGTIYDFKRNGQVVVYSKKPFDKKLGSFLDDENYVRNIYLSDVVHPHSNDASHLEILRRQLGYLPPELEKDPIEQTKYAISLVIPQIQKHLTEQNKTFASWNLHGLSIEETYSKISEHLTNHEINEADLALKKLLSLSDNADRNFLPDNFKWFNANKYEFFKVEKMPDNHYPQRVIRPFVVFKHLAPKNSSLGFIKILNTDIAQGPRSIHFQSVYAHLGNVGIELDKKNLIGGGHLAYEYNSHTGKLKKITIEKNGFISISKNERVQLTQPELENLIKDLREELQLFDPTNKVIIEISPEANKTEIYSN